MVGFFCWLDRGMEILYRFSMAYPRRQLSSAGEIITALEDAGDGSRCPQFCLPGDRQNPAVRSLVRLIFDLLRHRSGVRTLTTCQSPLPCTTVLPQISNASTIRSTRFSSTKLFVEKPLCGGCAPHQSLSMCSTRSGSLFRSSKEMKQYETCE